MAWINCSKHDHLRVHCTTREDRTHARTNSLTHIHTHTHARVHARTYLHQSSISTQLQRVVRGNVLVAGDDVCLDALELLEVSTLVASIPAQHT